MPVTYREDAKQAAIDQWTADPCGVIDGEPGTRDYFERLLDSREEYVLEGANGSWMAEVIDYAGSAGLRTLDVGSGQGMDVYRYAQAGAQATGIDLTPRHVELAQAHLTAMGVEGEIVRGDAESMPFADDTFDRVSSNGVLHHTPDMPGALREVRRVLKPSGRATVIVYHRDSTFFWISMILRDGIVRRRLRKESVSDILANVERSSIDAAPLVRVYSRRQLRRMMEDAGFTDVKIVVRHNWETFLTKRIRNRRVLDFLGRHAGWYVIAVASAGK
jgi:ubiquinone/menaquinone biosynthesis C-methylase UbiE